MADGLSRCSNLRLAFIGLTMAVALNVTAAQAAPMEEQSQGAVHYLTGGVGDEELARIKAAMPSYPLVMTFAAKQEGDFLSDVSVSITDSAGAQLLRASANGPYLLVKLPPGTYQVTATHKGQAIQRTVTLHASGNTPLVLEWAAGDHAGHGG